MNFKIPQKKTIENLKAWPIPHFAISKESIIIHTKHQSAKLKLGFIRSFQKNANKIRKVVEMEANIDEIPLCPCCYMPAFPEKLGILSTSSHFEKMSLTLSIFFTFLKYMSSLKSRMFDLQFFIHRNLFDFFVQLVEYVFVRR